MASLSVLLMASSRVSPYAITPGSASASAIQRPSSSRSSSMERFTLSFYSSAESTEAEPKPSLPRVSRVICDGSETMTQTSTATVEWNPEKKHWQGVVGRRGAKPPPDAGDEQLQALAMATARDEGYTLDEAHISIVR